MYQHPLSAPSSIYTGFLPFVADDIQTKLWPFLLIRLPYTHQRQKGEESAQHEDEEQEEDDDDDYVEEKDHAVRKEEIRMARL